jgi:hypothetical protein
MHFRKIVATSLIVLGACTCFISATAEKEEGVPEKGKKSGLSGLFGTMAGDIKGTYGKTKEGVKGAYKSARQKAGDAYGLFKEGAAKARGRLTSGSSKKPKST